MSDKPLGSDWWLASDGRWYPPTASPPVPPVPPVPPGPTASAYGVPGPGWWLASDGRWYPPQAAPGMSAPDVAAPGLPSDWYGAAPRGFAGRERVSAGLAGSLQGFYWALAAVSALVGLVGLAGLEAFSRFYEAPPRSYEEQVAIDDVESLDLTLVGLSLLVALVLLVVFVLQLVWVSQAHSVTRRLWRGHRRWTSGWSIGAWFIPVANFVLPKLVLNEIERIATAPRAQAEVQPAWPQQSTSGVGWIWWTSWVGGALLFRAGAALLDLTEGDATVWRVGYVLTAVAGAMLAVSGVAGALYVRRLTKALRA